MEVGRDEAEKLVGIAAAEEADREDLVGVDRVDPLQILHVELVVGAVDEWPDEIAVMEEMHPLRRHVDEVDMAFAQRAGGQGLGDQDREIEQPEKRSAPHRQPVLAELPPHQPPLRGEIDALLVRRQLLDRPRIERCLGHVMRHWRPGRRKWRACHHLVHFVLPPSSLIRGSRMANARSEMSTPTTVRKARNIRNEPARYMSWLWSALMSSGPVVSSDSTMAVISAPETIEGRIEPMSEMKKLSDILSGYFTSALKGCSPFALAVTTYCFCSSSSRLARTRLIMPAVPAVPMMMTGIQICSRIDLALAQLIGSLRYWLSIRWPSEVPNQMLARYMKTSASRKLGVASPSRPRKVRP